MWQFRHLVRRISRPGPSGKSWAPAAAAHVNPIAPITAATGAINLSIIFSAAAS
jgi:hypothetical protein